ncbi:hypothetical protein [Candidatus Nanohalobium constans]|uniref:Chromosome segregation ATPase n=1 Tax=Candidatus Nanohalobium constans TaxID=2565781 RepID=A0A5Q0UHI7_9ARCH|nr:hypothetical protein [Candidatus Nanohalobium constans]QGA80821.1 chromosome segregation ATPase [Candidatus Nanohalobium constans]
MKFKLFERLRDDGGSNPDNQTQGIGGNTSSPGLGDRGLDSNSDLGGGSLDRTVEQMFEQGYSEDEIKNELQGQYSEQEISNAVNNAVTSSATSQDDGPQPMTPYQSDDEPVSPMDEGYNDEPQKQENNTQQQKLSANNMQQPTQNQPTKNERQGQSVDPAVEELIETIVAENFQRVKAEFENMYEELDTIEEAVEDLENRVHDLEVRDDEDQEEFVQKVDEMEDHIDSYQSRIGGLEKAFQQVLPSLVDNVRDLTSLVQEMKQEKGIQTETNISSQDMEQVDEQLKDW